MMKKTFTILTVLLPLMSFAGFSWKTQNSGVTNVLYDVHFVGTDTGWVVGSSGIILKTTDGGTHWLTQTSGVTKDLKDVFFINSSTGWCVGWSGTVLYTTNGGLNWTKATSGSTEKLESVYFLNENTGFAAGYNGTFLKTSDGGQTWTSSSVLLGNNVQSICFNSNNAGYIAGNNSIVASTNSTTWKSTVTGSQKQNYDIAFINDLEGICVGGNDGGGVIYTTIDGGSNWKLQSITGTTTLRSVRYASATEVWVSGDGGVLLQSLDAGTTWSKIELDVTSSVHALEFPSPTRGYLVGNNGVIKKYSRDIEIGLVTVGETSMKNVVAWERFRDLDIKSYIVYKLTGTSYDSIGSVPIDSASYFIDYNSQPTVKSERYKIAARDIYGNLSDKSPYHETMNLGYSKGGEANTNVLYWNKYTVETGDFVPEWYYIYRGSQKATMEIYDSVAGAFNQYNDENVTEKMFYKIGVKLQYKVETKLLKSDSGPFSQSLSNLSESIILSDESNNASDQIVIFPNPATNTFELNGLDEKSNVFVESMDGHLIKQVEVADNDIVDIAGLANGSYLVKVQTNKGIISKTLIKCY